MIKRKFKIKRRKKKRITEEEWGRRRRGTEMKAKNGKGGGETRRM